MHRIIVLDDLSAEGLNLLRAEKEFEVVVQTGLKGDALRTALLDFDGAICRSGVKITADSLQGNRRLKAIVRAGVGTDNIDKAAATRMGTIVMNTPAGNTVSTAEHTMALILGLSRNVAPAHASLKSGKWDRKSFEGVELRGKVLGIVGLGRIGLRVAQLARAFEMRILGYDPFLPKSRSAELQIDLAESVENLLAQVDYLTVHTPLTAETSKLVGSEQLQRMKKGVRLINCARGGIYDEAALLQGLDSGQIGGVALDVYVEEPNTNSPLFQHPKTLCTPHLGASTEEAQRQVALEAVELLVNFLKSGEIRHAVNAAAIDAKALGRLQGFINLAFRLGAMASQWHGAAISHCELQFDGDVAGEDTRVLSSAFCAGLLDAASQSANLVNAELLCRERGVEITRNSRSSQGAFSSLISAKVSGDGSSFELAGTLFGKSMPRLVRLQGFNLEAFIDGCLLVFSHRDVPGIIAHIGAQLAKHKINIAAMSVGRAHHQPGGSAIGVLNLDAVPSAEVMPLLLEHPEIQSAKLIRLPAENAIPALM